MVEWIGDDQKNIGDKGLICKIKENDLYVEWFSVPPKNNMNNGPYNINDLKVI